MFFLQGPERTPYLFVRLAVNGTQPWASFLGVHELVIKRERDSDSILKLTRWSTTERRSKLWARLQFVTWEGQSSSSPFPKLLKRDLLRQGHACGAYLLTKEWWFCRADLVLFQYTFVSLKANSTRTLGIHPDECFVQREDRVFQA